MASPMRSAGMCGANSNPDHQHVLSVAPLNSMPYIGPPASDGGHAASPTKDDTNTKPMETVGPSMLFLPPHTSRQEWDNLMVSSKSGVGLTGSAAMGKVGPVVGLMDVGESDDAYLFRVSLPGVSRDENEEFHCDTEADGRVLIKGITTTGERTVCKYSQVFRMQTQNFCPPGHFSITFQLPGPVDQQQFSGRFATDGMLEGIVKKKLI